MEILEQNVPLRTDDRDVVRVGNTRVLFELVVRSYLQGHTPEEIVRQHSTLELADVYGALPISFSTEIRWKNTFSVEGSRQQKCEINCRRRKSPC